MRPPFPAFPQIPLLDLGEGAARLAFLDELPPNRDRQVQVFPTGMISALRAAQAEMERELPALRLSPCGMPYPTGTPREYHPGQGSVLDWAFKVDL